MLLGKRSNAVSPENTKAVYKTKVVTGESVGKPYQECETLQEKGCCERQFFAQVGHECVGAVARDETLRVKGDRTRLVLRYVLNGGRQLFPPRACRSRQSLKGPELDWT